MSEYRNKTTGEVKTQGEWRKANPNTSFPKVWTQDTLDFLDLEGVAVTNPPSTGQYEMARRNGVVKNANGTWEQSWEIVPMFSDDENSTRVEKEAAYQAQLDEKSAEQNRKIRDDLLAKTDYFALTDVTMDAAMTTYRQQLRDITAHENWPNLNEEDWPTKP